MIFSGKKVKIQVDFDRGSTYEVAIQRMSSLTHDLIALETMGARGLELVGHASAKGMAAVMSTAHALRSNNMKKSTERGAHAYLRKDRPGRIIPFLEAVMTLACGPAWKSLPMRLGKEFGKRFGPEWRRSENAF